MNPELEKYLERLTSKTSLSDDMLEALLLQAGVSMYRALDNERVSLRNTLEHYSPNAEDCHAIGNIFLKGGKFKYSMFFRGHTHYFYIKLSEENARDSLMWHYKAAKLGNVTSLFIVGLYLVFGIGTVQDIEKGNACIKKAAEEGCKEAKEWIDFPIVDARKHAEEVQRQAEAQRQAENSKEYYIFWDVTTKYGDTYDGRWHISKSEYERLLYCTKEQKAEFLSSKYNDHLPAKYLGEWDCEVNIRVAEF